MRLINALRTGAVVCGVALVSACVRDVSNEEDPALNQIRQSYVASIKSLRAVHGRLTFESLISANRLTVRNGLRAANGLKTINGLLTVNGRRVVNGLSVDCTGGAAGESCTGKPDGLLDDQTGLMRNDEGMMTAKYLMRCALRQQDSIRIKDYTGGLVVLSGELGLAPEWKDKPCDRSCQEQISACLMAFTKGEGADVELQLSRTWQPGTAARDVLQ